MRRVGDIWPASHVDRLRHNFAAGMSFSENSAEINAKFGTSYSRNSCIGKGKRIGLTQASKPRLKPEKPEPIVHIRRAHKTRPMPRYIAAPVNPGAAAKPGNLTIYDLTADTCRWPFGDRAPYTYCGCSTYPGYPYCAEHVALGTSPGTKAEQMAARGLERIA